MERLKPYPAYRDSGIPWLGKIPKHWEVKPLKHAVAMNADVLTEDTPSNYAMRYVDISNVDSNGRVLGMEEMAFRDAPSRARRLVQDGDTILSTVRTYLRAIAYMDKPADNLVVSTGFAVLRPSSKLDRRFLFRLVQSHQFVEKVVAYSQGVGYPAINPSTLACLPVWIPPLDEQWAMAEFLDRETGKLDALVARKERLIGLLQEKRSALISHAVTKGLNPTAPLRDSGIPWLGKIPKHWEVLPIKRRAKRIQTGTTPPTSEFEYYEDGTVNWFGPGSFTVDLALSQPVKLLSVKAVHDGVARIFEGGSTLIVTIGATIGKVGFLANDGSSNQQITAVTFDQRRVHPKFGAYQAKRLEPVLRGIAPSTTLPILDQEVVGNLPFLIPPREEQSAIAEYLDRETGKIDALIARVRDGIAALREYRTALISAVVTGKIAVNASASN